MIYFGAKLRECIAERRLTFMGNFEVSFFIWSHTKLKICYIAVNSGVQFENTALSTVRKNYIKNMYENQNKKQRVINNITFYITIAHN